MWGPRVSGRGRGGGLVLGRPVGTAGALRAARGGREEKGKVGCWAARSVSG